MDEMNSSLVDLTNTSSVTTAELANYSTAGAKSSFPSLSEIYILHHPSFITIDRYVTATWYVIGFPGNLLSFAVWIQPRMRPSSGCYLAALAAADFLFLVLHLFFELQAAWNVTLLSFPVLCEVFPVFFLASQYLSPLLVLGFTVERYISVCYPFQKERFCNTRRTVWMILMLVSVSVSLHLVQAYFWRYDADKNDCVVREEVTINDIQSLWSVWSWVTELLVFGIVPLTILVLNVLVICEAGKLTANEHRLLSGQQQHQQQQQQHSHRKSFIGGYHKSSAPSATTLMLLAVSFYLIVTTLPATVCYAIYYSFPEGSMKMKAEEMVADAHWQSHFQYWKARTIIQEICMSHYAGNFCIYVLTGRIFRKELWYMLYRWTRFCRKVKDDGDQRRRRPWNNDTEFSYSRAGATYTLNGLTTDRQDRTH